MGSGPVVCSHHISAGLRKVSKEETQKDDPGQKGIGRPGSLSFMTRMGAPCLSRLPYISSRLRKGRIAPAAP